jgi:Glycosyltransferase family 92
LLNIRMLISALFSSESTATQTMTPLKHIGNRIKNFWRILSDKRYRGSRRYRLPLVTKRTPKDSFEHYLTTATIVRDEARFLGEFVIFHKLAGVDHMLIYDDSSEDSIGAVLSPFIASGFVELIPWPRFRLNRNNQFLAYQHALAYMRGKSFWLAMMDCDEFLFSPTDTGVINQLKRREMFSALGIYSRTFGTSGMEDIPTGGLILECLTQRPRDECYKNNTQRTIVQPDFATAVRSANTVVLSDVNHLGWDENGTPIWATGEAGHSCDYLRINHYFTRARNDFLRKASRQYFGKEKLQEKMLSKKYEADEMDSDNITDTLIQKHVLGVKRLLS